MAIMCELGAPTSSHTMEMMGARSQKAQIKRLDAEFNTGRLAVQLKTPSDGRSIINAWDLANIYTAREQQMLGNFYRAARMAEQMRTDDALAVAYKNRLAPQRCISVKLKPKKGPRARTIAAEAEALFGQNGAGLTPDTIADIHGCLVNHGVAFATSSYTPREDGTRIDVKVSYWPIEYVRWDEHARCFLARVDTTSVHAADVQPKGTDYAFSTFEVPIVHGDGRWTVFAKHEDHPFRQDAAILPGAIVWARHAFAARDWAKGSVAHGNAKTLGSLPTGVPLQDKETGALTADATALVELLRGIASDDSPVGIKPAGATVEFITNNSTAWNVWSELVNNAEKAAARIYLGTDGTLGTNGGAPGVDITALFGVAATIVRGDLECLQRGFDTGVIQPWTAINFGDSSLAPCREYQIPNDEEEAVRADYAKRSKAFHDEMKSARDNGFDINQAYVNGIAEKHGIEAPLLPIQKIKAPSIALPYTVG